MLGIYVNLCIQSISIVYIPAECIDLAYIVDATATEFYDAPCSDCLTLPVSTDR